MVVQREGAGTSGRERERPGEGAGEGGSGLPRLTGAGLGPAEQRNTKLVSVDTSGLEHVCEILVSQFDTIISPLRCYPLRAVAYSVFSKKIVQICTLRFSPFFSHVSYSKS